jgi:hypothetical protein
MPSIFSCQSTERQFQTHVRQEFVNQPLRKAEVLSADDIIHLPGPVKKYLIYTGNVGKRKLRNVFIAFDAEMFRKKGDPPMKACSDQYNFFESYGRFFFMKAGKMGIPFRARHIYCDQKANFVVRVAGIFNAVDIKGEALTKAETVTVLNDMCLFAPAGLIDNRLSWKELDALSCEVTFTNGNFIVSAVLHFNEQGELVNFVSDDRSALQDDGTLKSARWSTPVGAYREIDGRKIPSYGEAIWNYPEGDFTYGKFTLKRIAYNLSGIDHQSTF